MAFFAGFLVPQVARDPVAGASPAVLPRWAALSGVSRFNPGSWSVIALGAGRGAGLVWRLQRWLPLMVVSADSELRVERLWSVSLGLVGIGPSRGEVAFAIVRFARYT